jgi:hypothetical protein
VVLLEQQTLGTLSLRQLGAHAARAGRRRLHDRFDRRQQGTADIRFRHEAARTGLERARQDLRRIVLTDDHDLRAG